MNSARRARTISLVLSMGVVYPFMLLADALDWSAPVQLALGLLALVTLVGTALLLTDWGEWRADREQLRRMRAEQKRERAETANLRRPRRIRT